MFKSLTSKIVIFSCLVFFTVLLSFYGWSFLRATQQKNITQNVQNLSKRFSQQFQQRLIKDSQPLKRIAKRWEVRGGTPQVEWSSDAKQIIKDNGTYRAIALLNRNEHLHWIVTSNSVNTRLNLTSLFNKPMFDVLHQRSGFDGILISDVASIKNKHRSIVELVPLSISGKLDGYIAGIFNLRNFLMPVGNAADLAPFNLIVYQGGKIIYQHAKHKHVASQYLLKENITYGEFKLQYELIPSLSYVKSLSTRLPHYFLAIGLFVALLVFLLGCLLIVLQVRSEKFRKSTQEFSLVYSLFQAVINPIIVSISSLLDVSLTTDKLKKMAYYDALTGLNNRAFFEEAAKDAVKKSRRSDQTTALLLVDVDNFRSINEAFGIQLADILLKQIAERIQNTAHRNDVVARLDADKFAIISVNEDSAHEVGVYAKKIIQSFNKIFEIRGNKIGVGVSVGIACYPMSGKRSDVLINHAEESLRKAKREGEGHYRFYNNQVQKSHDRRITIEEGVLLAIKNDEFKLVYQLQYDLQTQMPTGMEALLRWKHPLLGMVPPDEFILVAEETGKMKEIGLWVLNQSFKEFKSVKAFLPRDFILSINLSIKQFSYKKLVENIEKARSTFDLASHQLAFEITETSVMENLSVIPELERLRELGCLIAIDDFGTGYSSLARLKDFPTDSLKIDKSFILGSSESHELRAIIDNTIQLAKELNLKIVAEGIENTEQLDFLISKGCPHGQGFFLAKPVSIQEIKEMFS